MTMATMSDATDTKKSVDVTPGTNKILGGGVAAAATVLVVFVLEDVLGTSVTTELKTAISTLVGVAVFWYLPEKYTVTRQ